MKVVNDEESLEHGSESDSLNVKVIPSDILKFYKIIKNLLPSEEFALVYVDEFDQYQFIHGEMDLDKLLALKSVADIELFTACMSLMLGEIE